MKLLLTVTNGTLAGRVFELETGFITVGRGETCTVRFDPQGERIASKQHAFIEARPDGYYITDNNSTNGTLVNGARVQLAKLASGDSVQFGKNGVVATVQIQDAQAFQHPIPQESFRQIQINQYEQVAEHQPEGFQNSIVNIGLGQLAVHPQPVSTGKYIGIAITIMAIVFMSLVVVGITFLSVGIIPAIIAAFVAFVPALFYIIPLMWLDRYDPEPLWLLALAFAWGALVAIIISIIVNTAIGAAVAMSVSPEAGEFAGAVISAPIFEESSKGMGLLILLIFFRRYFDDILDGIVFAGVIALGFATVENVLYYGRALVGGGILMMAFLVLIRGVLSPFAHVFFTSMTGIGCGISRESHNTFVKIVAPVIGYFFAVSLHAMWNAMAMYATDVLYELGLVWVCDSMGLTLSLVSLCSFLITYALLQVPLFLIFVIFALYTMYRQNKILKEMLAIDVARGLIPADHAAKARSAVMGSVWLIGGVFTGKYRARRKYMRAIGKLGLSYWHIQRATAAQGHTGSFQQNPILRDEVLKWRDKVD